MNAAHCVAYDVNALQTKQLVITGLECKILTLVSTLL